MLPNLVIIGAPKCGTSSLFNWLASHSEICSTVRKEPFFLMDLDNPLKGSVNVHDFGLDGYVRLFPPAAADARIRMEGTTHYLFQKTALEVLSGLSDVRVCVVLRDPAERVFSSFNYTKHNLASLRPNLSFSEYLDLVKRSVPLYPLHCRNRSSAWVLERDLQYSDYSRYLRQWFAKLGRDRVEVILFDELRSNPRAVTSGITDRLDLPPLDQAVFDGQVYNATLPMRSHALHSIARRLGLSVVLPARMKSAASKAYYRLQRSNSAVTDEDRQALTRLRRFFDTKVDELENLLGRSLDHWRVL